MMASTTLLNFTVDKDVKQDEWEEKLMKMKGIFEKAGFGKVHCNQEDGGTGFLTLFGGDDGRTALVQSYPGLVTLNIQTPLDKNGTKFGDAETKEFETNIADLLQAQNSKRFPSIQRGVAVDRYVPTVDRRLVEYDFDRVVFEANSQYQHIKIMHSPQYGNMLILDGDPNLAESDLAYTRAILGNGRESFQGKTVLILGGGDGGILHEVLKEKPEFVTMVEIDQIVIDAAIKHLRGICHNAMDSLTGPNYEVLVEDCIPILESYAEKGKMFDYVINDLTAIPITTEPMGSQWDFLRLILQRSMKVLKNSGKYFTQGNGAIMTQALQMYEHQLELLDCSVEFSKETVCVPSYMEMWVFYEIWKVPPQKKKGTET